MKIKLGSLVRDVVTGFIGVATSRVEYLNGCIQYCVTPPVDKDGAMRPGEYIDHQRLVVEAVIGEPGAIAAAVSDTGGPQRDAPSGVYRG